LRQAYDYWQDQPGSYHRSRDNVAEPRLPLLAQDTRLVPIHTAVPHLREVSHNQDRSTVGDNECQPLLLACGRNFVENVPRKFLRIQANKELNAAGCRSPPHISRENRECLGTAPCATDPSPDLQVFPGPPNNTTVPASRSAARSQTHVSTCAVRSQRLPLGAPLCKVP